MPHEVRVVSAHRTPDLLFEYAATARERGLEVIIAGAGGAAHLPGMTAAKTSLPVLGVPVQSKALNGLDSLLSIVQMPAGVPVGTLAIGAGRRDQRRAARRGDPRQPRTPTIRTALDAFRAAQTDQVLSRNPIRGSARRRDEDRRHRRRPARAHAGARRLSARRCVSAFLDPSADSPGGQVAPIVTGAFDDPASLEQLAADVDVVTYEFENVPVEPHCSACPAAVPVPAARRGAARLAGPALREGALCASSASRRRRSARSNRWRELDAAVADIGLPAC